MSAMVRVRDVLGGRYELLEVIGRGGMGVVYRANDRVLERQVAVKVLPVDRAENPTLVTRFEREARAAAALNHPNIVGVFDSGRDEDVRYIVMEYVAGENLAELLRRRGPLPASECVDIGSEVASALAAAHQAGIVHRDIKPANVMVDAAGTVKVLDFGIARAAASTSLTQAATVLGSAPYLAPEISQGKPADERSDIYSLGCVLYEVLTGRPPFTAEHPAAVMNQHVTAPPQPIRDLRATVPTALEVLSLQMLAKEPSARPRTAAEVAHRLPEALDETAASAPLMPTAATAPMARAPLGPAPLGGSPSPLSETAAASSVERRRFSGLAAMLIATLAVLAAAGVALALLGVLKAPGHQAGAVSTGTRATSTPTTTASGPQKTTAPPTSSTSTTRTSTTATTSTTTSTATATATAPSTPSTPSAPPPPTSTGH
jgi:serine/threonine protein kinase